MTRVIASALLFLLLVVSPAPLVLKAQGPPPRLIADNRTPYIVVIYAWNGTGWNFVSRLNPRSWMAFPNAAQGSYWRAMIGQAARDHKVNYYYDPGYGGSQSIWIIQ